MRSILLALVLAGCATATVEPVTLAGDWGGEQISLHVTADGIGHIELSCASVEFAGPVTVGVGGHFLTKGAFRRGTGVATMHPPPAEPATISGRLDPGGHLWLDVAIRDSYPVRSARLERGVEANLLRCL